MSDIVPDAIAWRTSGALSTGEGVVQKDPLCTDRLCDRQTGLKLVQKARATSSVVALSATDFATKP
ncbi:hypothetical protein [Arthrobacter pityocampae]|uniref:hypothetical protein n=1 Tax=Arthrobacter pityocampae TaxID=547334 RepID=UPI00187EFF02|nr:hypothetical protein [Arthrobacter pityocampae]